MSKITSPHDKIFKISMQNKEIAKAFFEHHLPAKIKEHIDLGSLQLEPESFIDKNQQAHYSDILYKVNINQQAGYLFLLAEHQSTPERLMPFRILKYMCLIWDKHLKNTTKNQDTTLLPVIYPLVFYHGKQSPYPYSADIFDCFADKSLAKSILLQPFHLVDITQISDTELTTHGLASPFELLQKHILLRDLQKTIDLILEQGLLKILQDGEYLLHLVRYIINTGELADITGFFEKITEALPNERENIMTIAEQLKQQGKNEGLQQGRIERDIEIARKMLNKGTSITTIAEVTELSIEEIKKLKS